MNIFDVFNIFYREDTITDFLINCFNDSNEFLIQFLNVAGIQIEENTKFHIDTRVGLGRNIGTPDIIIRAQDNNQMRFIIVENKIGAMERYEQTNRYESKEARSRIASKYNYTLEDIEFHFIFLVLDTSIKPKNIRFTFLNYRMFLDGVWPLKQEKLNLAFNDFQMKLHNFYTPINSPYESIELNFEMDGIQRKICWQTILHDSFYARNDLDLDWGEINGAGRSNFIFLVSKLNWKSNEPFQDVGLGQTFNVHFDTYINMLDNGRKHVKEIGIRFESFPYVPHKKIESQIGYDKFMDNKLIFSDRLFEIAKKRGVIAKQKKTKLLVMTIEIQSKAIREIIQNIIKQFSEIELCIDEVILSMKKDNLIK